MITIRGGNYHTLAEVALRFKTNRMRISRLAKKLGLGIRFGRLTLRFHDSDIKKISRVLTNKR